MPVDWIVEIPKVFTVGDRVKLVRHNLYTADRVSIGEIATVTNAYDRLDYDYMTEHNIDVKWDNPNIVGAIYGWPAELFELIEDPAREVKKMVEKATEEFREGLDKAVDEAVDSFRKELNAKFNIN